MPFYGASREAIIFAAIAGTILVVGLMLAIPAIITFLAGCAIERDLRDLKSRTTGSIPVLRKKEENDHG